MQDVALRGSGNNFQTPGHDIRISGKTDTTKAPTKWGSLMQSLRASLEDVRSPPALRSLRTSVGSAFTDFWADVQAPVTDVDPSVLVDQFDEQIESPSGARPNFIRGTAPEAAASAQKRRQCMLVCAYSTKSAASASFFRDVLCSAPVVQLVNARCVSWLANVDYRHGWMVAREFKARAPSVTVVFDSARGQRTILGTLSDGCCFVRCKSADEFIAQLMPMIDAAQQLADAEPDHADTARAERERLQRQLLLDEQEAAYQQALLADQQAMFVDRFNQPTVQPADQQQHVDDAGRQPVSSSAYHRHDARADVAIAADRPTQQPAEQQATEPQAEASLDTNSVVEQRAQASPPSEDAATRRRRMADAALRRLQNSGV